MRKAGKIRYVTKAEAQLCSGRLRPGWNITVDLIEAFMRKTITIPDRGFAAAHIMAKSIANIDSRGALPDGCFCVTEDGKKMFRGDVLFELKATHGFPLDFALDRIISQEGMAVDWVAFIEAARKNKWWDFQTYEAIDHAMVDAMITKDSRKAILDRFKLYVLRVPHPVMPVA